MSDSLKATKTNSNLCYNNHCPHYIPQQKPPLPFIRKSLPNDPKMREKFKVRGDKYFSKVVVSGPETVITLKKIHNSQLKYIKSFEFDPYLCDFSGIRLLAKVFRKLSLIKSLNLVIRRVDRKGESNCLTPFLSRLILLQKLRIEFPSTENFDDRDIFNLISGIRKCYNLKQFKTHFISLPVVTTKSLGAILISLKGMHNLEELSINMLNKESIFEDDIKIPNHSFPKLPKLKDFKLFMGRSSSEWVELKKESDKIAQQFLRSFSKAMNPEKFAIKLHGAGQQDDDMRQILTETLSGMTNLRHLSYEFLNSNQSDLSILNMMQEIKEYPRLERFTLKIIQHPNVSEEIIYPFVSCLSKFENIKRCDLYFRRFNVPGEDVKEIANKLQKIENVHCSTFNQSLYVWWDKYKES